MGPKTTRTLMLALVVGVVAFVVLHRPVPPSPSIETPKHVGSEACAACHPNEADAWRASQHAHAMQRATDETVRGDFGGASITSHGVTSTFFRRDGGFIVHTAGPDSGLADFTVTWTFGVAPLQQLLVDFPDGRKQALALAWDTRPADAGGQRWFDVFPGEPLRWTGPELNWNHQCADCHATNVRKGFDAGGFSTTWSEVAVGCEACHGPGSRHLAWAEHPDGDPAKGLTVALDERRGVTWLHADGGATAGRSSRRASSRELDVCARCHARREQLTDAITPGDAFTDGFRPALLEPGLFFVDGQQRDEVYTWTSFLESRMAARGVTCADCHEPHSGKLRGEGNAVCASCHDAAVFDAPAHHHHASGSPGAACVACHLPPTTYMQVDPRHDHSLRIPRPDRTVALGTPNACTTCHTDHDAAWAVDALSSWFPAHTPGFQDFAETFAAAESGAPAALDALAALATRPDEPAVVRASALLRLYASRPSALSSTLADDSTLVRFAAVRAAAELDAATRVPLLTARLGDASRLVRIEAARALAGLVDDSRATGELLDELQRNGDRPDAQVTLGRFRLARHDIAGAEAAFRAALRIEPAFVAASMNLADVLRARGDEAQAEQVLRAALERTPDAAALHHALGLALVRQRHAADALPELLRAASLAPDDARFAYVAAVALHDGGRGAEALRAVDAALSRRPWDRGLLFAAASWRLEAGRRSDARAFIERLLALAPDDADARALEHAAGNPSP